MAVLPCIQCPTCGLWNQFTLTKCECGTDLRRCKVRLTDVGKLSVMDYGEIQEDLAAYGQICPKCGEIAFTVSPRQRHTSCPGCKSTAIAAFRPIHYLDLPEE